MKISARNMLKGKVKSVTQGPVSAEVVITLANGVDVTSVITESAAKELELKTGSAVYAVIKASSVIVAMD